MTQVNPIMQSNVGDSIDHTMQRLGIELLVVRYSQSVPPSVRLSLKCQQAFQIDNAGTDWGYLQAIILQLRLLALWITMVGCLPCELWPESVVRICCLRSWKIRKHHSLGDQSQRCSIQRISARFEVMSGVFHSSFRKQ